MTFYETINLNLEDSLKAGAFREDLYYRINVFPIYLPALRERKTDIALLADFFLDRCNDKYGKDIIRISTSATDLLMAYHWPGNVRELENCIERAVLLCQDRIIQPFNFPPTLQTSEKTDVTHPTSIGAIQRNLEMGLVEGALKDTGGNMAAAARILGTTERVMGLRVKKYGIDLKAYRSRSRQV